jgi:UDP-GlcNAc:undecaprenyl-phosphate/decaprenyl-phosphate GlcNAc-1-phosphate transferase
MSFAVTGTPLLAFFMAYVASVVLVPLVLTVATKYHLFDVPDGERRLHASPIPRLGGVGVFLAVFTVIVVGALFDNGNLRIARPQLVSILLGATVLFTTGLIDDLRGVRPLMKLIAQGIAAVLVYWFGFRIHSVTIVPGHIIELGMFAAPVTLLWIVGVSNAFNLIDGADGLAGGVAVIALAATALSASVTNDYPVVWGSLALMGAMLGFLRHNFPPARIFLGDSGSLVVGFSLAVLTVKGATSQQGVVQGLTPIFALAYPLLDTGISMMRRWLRADPLSRADGRHIHHRLAALGLGPRQTILVIYGLSSAVAFLGLCIVYAPPEFTIGISAAGGVVLLLILVYGLQWLQYHEFLEAGAVLASFVTKGRVVMRDQIFAREAVSRIREARSLEEVAEILALYCSEFRFLRMELQGCGLVPSHDEPVQLHLHSGQTWKLEYPVIPFGFETTSPIVLSIWCSIHGTNSSAGAERVARVLAPAIANWLLVHRDDETVSALSMHRSSHLRVRSSGDFAAVEAPARERRRGRERRGSGGSDRTNVHGR